MSCGEIITIIIAALTLIVTTYSFRYTIKQHHQKKKEDFINMVFEQLKDVAYYVYDIANNKNPSNKEYLCVDRIREAEEKLTVGFTYLYEYARSNNLKLMKIAMDINPKKELRDISFGYQFYRLNGKFHDFRESIVGKPKTAEINDKLDQYCNAFREFLYFPIKHAIKYLNNKKIDEQTILTRENSFKENLVKLKTFCEENKLL